MDVLGGGWWWVAIGDGVALGFLEPGTWNLEPDNLEPDNLKKG